MNLMSSMSVETVADHVAERETQFPSIWSDKQLIDYKQKYPWLTAKSGRLGCTVCSRVTDLKLDRKRGIQINVAWSKCNISSAGATRETQLSSLT